MSSYRNSSVLAATSETATSAPVDSQGWTALHWAVQRGNVDRIKQLISAGAPVNQPDHDGETPLAMLYNASVGERFPTNRHVCARVLLEAGADPNWVGNRYPEQSLIILATRWHDIPMMRLLIEFGATVDPPEGRATQSALHCAVKENIPDAVALLLEAGAEINRRDGMGRTPIWYAFNLKSPEILERLLQAKADVHIADVGLRTPLHQAAWQNAFWAIEPLIRAGADCHAKTKEGQTPADLADSRDMAELIKIHAARQALMRAVSDDAQNGSEEDGRCPLNL